MSCPRRFHSECCSCACMCPVRHWHVGERRPSRFLLPPLPVPLGFGFGPDGEPKALPSLGMTQAGALGITRESENNTRGSCADRALRWRLRRRRAASRPTFPAHPAGLQHVGNILPELLPQFVQGSLRSVYPRLLCITSRSRRGLGGGCRLACRHLPLCRGSGPRICGLEPTHLLITVAAALC